jgi:hypothetical protein
MQLNGINIQPKIGSDFQTQYGQVDTAINANTMVQVSNPSAQHYNQTKVTQNTNPEKIAENIAKYETAQGNMMKMFHGID